MKRRNSRSKIRERMTCAVRPRPGFRQQALAVCRGRIFRCALGPAGILARKREGDGATPSGRWRLVEVLYRADRVGRPRTALPARPIGRKDGWCDAPCDRNYNRRVSLPYRASAEALWREDAAYDLVVVLDHNMRPRVRGRGSAVFIHLASEAYAPTKGCIAFSFRDLMQLLARAGPGSAISILP